MITSLSITDSYPFNMLALCIWREARGEMMLAKEAVAWSIRNRVLHPRWWGRDWVGVVLMPFQYSSFNHNDPNATKLPLASDPSWRDCLNVASRMFTSIPQPTDTLDLTDPTAGADSYFDTSLDTNPPKWAVDGSHQKTCDVGRIHFYKTL